MKALLFSWAGSLNTPQIFESHFDFKYKKQRIAYVPNAKDFLDKPERISEVNSSMSRTEKGVKSVTEFNLYKMADKWSVDYMIENFDTIYVGGGMMAPLLQAVFETGFDQLLDDLGSTNIKYVGSSAGAMLASKTMKVAGWYPNEEEPGVATKRGLAWIPFEIFSHYEEAKHKEVVQKKIDEPIIILPDNSAVGIEKNELRFYNQARLLI
jgi:peptidase E